jgi:hypothetical protein
MGFEAVYETTDEIIRELNDSSYEKNISTDISALLRESDQVLFATWMPPYDQAARAIDRALVPVHSVLDENRRRKEDAAAREAKTETAQRDGQAVSPAVPSGEEKT